MGWHPVTGKHSEPNVRIWTSYASVESSVINAKTVDIFNGTTLDVPRPPVGGCGLWLVTTCANMEEQSFRGTSHVLGDKTHT